MWGDGYLGRLDIGLVQEMDLFCVLGLVILDYIVI